MFSQSMVLPYTGILISLAGYLLGMWLFKISHGFFLFTPLLVGMVFGIAVLAIWAKGIGSTTLLSTLSTTCQVETSSSGS